MPTYKDNNNNLHFLDSADFEHLLPPGSVEITDAEAEALRAAQVPVPSAAQLWSAFQNEAQLAIDKSDITLGRCFEAGKQLPAEWVTYREALRAILRAATGDASQGLPARPAYP